LESSDIAVLISIYLITLASTKLFINPLIHPEIRWTFRGRPPDQTYAPSDQNESSLFSVAL
jgi:hypothetical protein